MTDLSSLAASQQQPLIKVKWPHGGWLVWNWSTRDWDYLKGQSDD